MRARVGSVCFVLGSEWTLPPFFLDPAVSSLHGVYVVHSSGLQLHVRNWNIVGDEAALLAQLHAQASPPLDVRVKRIRSTTFVSGTFARRGTGNFDRVREWFISDGTQAANAAFPYARDTATEVLTDCERLVDSIEFATR